MGNIKLSEIKINPNNPQKFDDLTKLGNSVRDFPKMFKYRPIVLDKENMVLGGNKRVVCLRELGFKEIPNEWVKYADDLTVDEQRRFIITDNISYGTWDFDILKLEWGLDDLNNWGLDTDLFNDEEIPDFDGENKEFNVDVGKCPKCGFEWEKSR